MSEVPRQILDIAERLGRNERVNRRSVEVLLKWFGAKKRGEVVVSRIRAALLSAGLETDPDFTQCSSIDDSITFRLAETAPPPPTGLERRNPDQAEPTPGPTAKAMRVQTSARSDEPSDDFLEPELDDEEPLSDDDAPQIGP
jgi:hypothetical protein